MHHQKKSPARRTHGAGARAFLSDGNDANHSKATAAAQVPSSDGGALWSSQQNAALDAIAKWLRSGAQEQVFRLFGYAGTGKTTLAKHIAGGARGEVVFAAYTGKAAHVMRRKGCHDASTIHHLIYRFEREKRGQPEFVLDRESRASRASLIIIDECSMVDERIGQDLLAFGRPILVLGDPAQLPPVNGGSFFTAAKPDIMLTEVHRQARDNPIIAMATTVREGGRLRIGKYGTSRVTDGTVDEHAADQVLVGTNRMRRRVNRYMRDKEEILPLAGDKLVCLRNDYNRGLLNGSLWTVEKVLEARDDGPIWLRVRSDLGDIIRVETHAAFFNGDELEYWERRKYAEFDFGYALTVHKAQGSQWDKVILFDEAACFRPDSCRWLYTGITRAAEQITVVQQRVVLP